MLVLESCYIGDHYTKVSDPERYVDIVGHSFSFKQEAHLMFIDLQNNRLFPEPDSRASSAADYVTVTVGGGFSGQHVVKRLFARPGTRFEVKEIIVCKVCLPDMRLLRIEFTETPTALEGLPVVVREQYGDVQLLIETQDRVSVNPDYIAVAK